MDDPNTSRSQAGREDDGGGDHGHHHHVEKKKNDDGGSSSCQVKKMNRERLVRYVHDIIKKQRTPLYEIIRDHVLPFLPVRSLHRFRTVSSSWNQHISTPFFAHTQSISNLSPSGLFLVCPQTNPPSCYYPFDPTSANAIPDPLLGFLPTELTHVIATSHGLLCCSDPFTGIVNLPKYCISNPATKEWEHVPLPGHKHYGVVLVYDPSPLNFCSDFDLVCCYCPKGLQPEEDPLWVTIRFEVFSSRTGVWRHSSRQLTCQRPLFSPHGVSAGGKAYWRTTHGTIVGYDPATNSSLELGIPEEARGGFAVWQLGEHKGELCCVACVCCSDAWNVVVSVVEKGGDGEETRWREVRTFEEVGGEDVRVLGLEGGEVVLWVDGVVVGRDVESGRGRILCFSGVPTKGAMDASECMMYVSSLAPVKKLSKDRVLVESGDGELGR